jgi:hypothetical protein
MVLAIAIAAAGGYTAYQRYYLSDQNNVKIQSDFLCKTLKTC